MKYFGIIDKNLAAKFQLQCKIRNISDMFLQYSVLCGVLQIISYKNFKARALGHLESVNTFCDNLKQGMAQLEKNYSPSNIYNLIVKRSFL